MAAKEPKVENFRAYIVDDATHKQLWVRRFTRGTLFLTLLSAIFLLVIGVYCLLAFTPVKTFIPGYPDAHTQRATLKNAIRVDSLENVILKWEFYSENLKRIFSEEEPVRIDSIIRISLSDSVSAEDLRRLHGSDSTLRRDVADAERFSLNSRPDRKLPIEGMHFFTPLKGVVSQEYDKLMHPYIDITAPANSVVTAVLDGTVISAGWSDESGYSILIQHESNLISAYKHNQKLLKRQGERVTAGSPIALVGNTGSLTTGDHLHFELWYAGDPVDPTHYINF